MKKEWSAQSGNLDALMDRLNEAYANNQLEDYRALELKESFDEATTCALQWGPMMRT